MPSKKMDEDLFRSEAPLAAFSARIKLAFYLGKISAECRSDLDIIRKVRNDFAHSPQDITFETASIADRCRNLAFSHHEKTHRARGHFTSAAAAILAQLHTRTFLAAPPQQATDDRPSEETKEEARLEAINRMIDQNPEVLAELAKDAGQTIQEFIESTTKDLPTADSNARC